jgi:tripeptide aminopeptidase
MLPGTRRCRLGAGACPSGLSSRAVDANGYRSDLARELGPDARERLVRYAQVWTTSDPDSPSAPSTERQLDLSRMLLDELLGLGLEAELSDAGIVYGTLPGNTNAPTIGLVAHVDTSPDVSGENVKPQVFRYEGGPHALPGDPSQVLDPGEWPELANHIGHELISSDGTTLLGADDKAGVAEIMTAVAYLVGSPDVPHGTVKIAFTPDEEVGRGVDNFDVEGFGAEVAYTLDGSTAGEIQDETFSALEARVRFRGRAVHPGYAKDILVNAVRLAADFVAALPHDISPERTDERNGFIHPTRIEGDAENVEVRMILRDFDDEKLERYAELVRETAEKIGGAEVEIRRQYRNMKEYLDAVPHAVELADEAVRRAGLEPARSLVRGGTDGSRLSEFGLPTPNIFTGGQQYHSQREWICVADMGAAAETIVHLVQLWAERAEAPEGASASHSASA